MSRRPWLLALAGCLLAPAVGAHDHDHDAAPGSADPKAAWQKSLTRPPLAVGLAFDARGRLWRAAVVDGRLQVSRSADGGRTFTTPIAVNRDPERIAADGDNRPKLAFGDRGEIYVSWTESLEPPYSGHVRFSRSLDDGRSFGAPRTVNDNVEAISHRFESLLVDGRGRVWLVWIDKRDAGAARQRGESYAGAALYSAVSEDRGAHFAANRLLAEHSCECCRIALALDTDGTPVVFWRHVFDPNIRDHALMRLDAARALRRISHENWSVDACPHHGPALAVGSDGAYHLAWFSGAPDHTGLFYARSTDRGATTSAPLPFGASDAQAGHPAVAVTGRSVVLAWKEFDGQAGVVRVMQSADGGEHWSAAHTALRSAGASDYPLLVSHGSQIVLAWNTAGEGLRLQTVAPSAP